MGIRFIKILILAVFCFCVSESFSYAKSVDSRYFSDFEVKKKINDKLDVIIQPTLRFKDDMGTLYYFHLRNGLNYHALKNLDLGVTYRHMQTRSNTDEEEWTIENRGEFDILPKFNIGKLKISDRNRFEYRYFENTKYDKWRYRNLLKFDYPVTILNKPVTLWCSEEIFYPMNAKEITTHWITAGLTKSLTENSNVQLYWRVDLTRTAEGVGHYNKIYILGSKISWFFN